MTKIIKLDSILFTMALFAMSGTIVWYLLVLLYDYVKQVTL